MAGHPPRGRPTTTPAARNPHRACRPRGQCWAPTPTHPRPRHVGDGPQQPAQCAGSLGRGSAWPQTPLTTVEGNLPRDALPPPPQRATPAPRAHAVGPVLVPHARTNRTRDTWVVEPRLPAREDGRLGEGQRLTPDTPHNSGRPPPQGTAPHHPRSTQPPQGMQAKGTVLAPHANTRAPTARGWRTPTARPVGGQSAEGGRLASDAPRNGRGHPPRGRPSAIPTASNAGPQERKLWGRCWDPTPAPTTPGTHDRGTPAARPRGRAARGGIAPDTRRPSEQWQATPPGDGPPPPPRHAALTGHAGQGDSVGPPQPHTRAHSMWVADPNSPPRGRAVGGGGAPDHRRPSQRWKAPPPGTPLRHPHSEQCRPARAHAVGPVQGPHARTDRTQDTRVAEPRLPAPEDGRPGEGQRLTPDAPHNGGRPLPPGTAPHHPRGTQPPQGIQAKGTVLGPHSHTPAPDARGCRTVTARPVGGQSGEAGRLASHAPHNGGRHPPGDALPPPPQRATPARKGARCGACAGSPHPHRPHPGHTGRRTPAPRPRGRAAGGGTAPDTGRPSQRWQATPPRGRPPTTPAARSPHRACKPRGQCVGPPHPHARAHSMWVADPNSPPSGRAVPGGGAPDHRRPSQRWKAPPPGTPFRQPHSEQRRPAKVHAVGPVPGPTPAPTTPGTHGSRNPGCPPQRTGGRGGDSA